MSERKIQRVFSLDCFDIAGGFAGARAISARFCFRLAARRAARRSNFARINRLTERLTLRNARAGSSSVSNSELESDVVVAGIVLHLMFVSTDIFSVLAIELVRLASSSIFWSSVELPVFVPSDT